MMLFTNAMVRKGCGRPVPPGLHVFTPSAEGSITCPIQIAIDHLT
jgi:hypothetical protein